MDKSFMDMTFRNTDDSIAYFFPALANNIKGNFEMFYPILGHPAQDSIKRMEGVVKGSKVQVEINSSSMLNAWTYPMAGSVAEISLANALPIGALAHLVSRLHKSLTWNFAHKINAEKRQVMFTNLPSDALFLSFETRGIRGGMDPDELTAIDLHEIGHWVSVDLANLSYIFRIITAMASALPPLNVIPLVAAIYFARSAEWASDAFAKKVGYGPALASSFVKMGYKVRTNVSLIDSYLDALTRWSVSINDILDDFIPTSTHPSMKKRIAAAIAKPGQQQNKLAMYSYKGSPLDQVQEQAFEAIKKALTPMDKYFAASAHRILKI